MAWICPKCGRIFRNTNQWHSCELIAPESHFDKIPSHIRDLSMIIYKNLEISKAKYAHYIKIDEREDFDHEFPASLIEAYQFSLK